MTLAATGVIASCSTGSMACADARFVVLAEEACDLCPTTRAVEQHRRGGVREKRPGGCMESSTSAGVRTRDFQARSAADEHTRTFFDLLHGMHAQCVHPDSCIYRSIRASIAIMAS